MTEFSEAELTYLKSQRLGRLATVDPKGQPQANPVGFFPQDDGTILVGGYALGTTKKWRNLQKNPKVALVVDDIVSLQPVEGARRRHPGRGGTPHRPARVGPALQRGADPDPPAADPQLGAGAD